MTVFVDLLMDNGELVRIECPDRHADELYETLENATKTNSWWSPGQFEGCKAEYIGQSLERIAMRRVVGVL